jgi:hypothetical protein
MLAKVMSRNFRKGRTSFLIKRFSAAYLAFISPHSFLSDVKAELSTMHVRELALPLWRETPFHTADG